MSVIKCYPITGRTHQIRVHMASEGHGLIGDKTYCQNKRAMPSSISQETQEFVKNFPRQALHSYKIAFLHPRSNEEMEFEIELADDLKELKTHLLAK